MSDNATAAASAPAQPYAKTDRVKVSTFGEATLSLYKTTFAKDGNSVEGVEISKLPRARWDAAAKAYVAKPVNLRLSFDELADLVKVALYDEEVRAKVDILSVLKSQSAA